MPFNKITLNDTPYCKPILLQRAREFSEKLYAGYYTEISVLKATAYISPEPLEFKRRFEGERREIALGESWGRLWDCAWFLFETKIPSEYQGSDKLCFRVDLSGEGLVFDEEKGALLGLTNGSVVPGGQGITGKKIIPLDYCRRDGDRVFVWVDAGCNDMFGTLPDNGTLSEAHLVELNPLLRDFYYDFLTLFQAYNYLDKNSPRANSILFALNNAIDLLHDYGDEELIAARALLKPELEKRGGDPTLEIYAIGHAHMDLAWLWPIRETKRKGARTLATALHLMDKYPDYRFCCSQPQLFLWVKENFPKLYERVKERIKDKRLEVVGAMWVEADTNLAGGEALIRQIMYGKEFYKEEFGLEVDNLWLPDVFGYSASLPQILSKCDVPYFITQKLSWSRHNEFPYHTFIWEGNDGSSVLSHMLPESLYNGRATTESIRTIETNDRESGLMKRSLMAFGIGNGGGGPSARHLESLDRIKNLEGFSPVKQEFIGTFLKDLQGDIEEKRFIPRAWQGELYLEFHRGTYTSQAKTKYYNRKMQTALRELEYAATLAMNFADKQYPQQEIEEIWKEVLLYQFHDILPGSSIQRVYAECIERYKLLLQRTEEMTRDCYSSLCKAGTSALFNSLSFPRTTVVKQNEKECLLDIPAFSAVTLNGAKSADKSALVAEKNRLENDVLHVLFNDDASIHSVTLKDGKQEFLPSGHSANELCIYEDDGNAWEVNVYYDRQTPKRFTLTDSKFYTTETAAVMENRYKCNLSTLVQTVTLCAGKGYIRFDTTVDWHETNKMLRTSFPVDAKSDYAVCNIQFGNIDRPTVRGNNLDAAMFEVPVQKWVDISDDRRGAALINDSKHGYKVQGNVMDLNLLRSSMYPGVDADKDTHEFMYAYYPHLGDEISGGVEKVAVELNTDTTVVIGSADNDCFESLIKYLDDGVMVEAVKKNQKGDDTVIRLYECEGRHRTTEIKLHSMFGNVYESNMTERERTDLNICNDKITLTFTPFEVKTIILSKRKE